MRSEYSPPRPLDAIAAGDSGRREGCVVPGAGKAFAAAGALLPLEGCARPAGGDAIRFVPLNRNTRSPLSGSITPAAKTGAAV